MTLPRIARLSRPRPDLEDAFPGRVNLAALSAQLRRDTRDLRATRAEVSRARSSR